MQNTDLLGIRIWMESNWKGSGFRQNRDFRIIFSIQVWEDALLGALDKVRYTFEWSDFHQNEHLSDKIRALD